MKKIFAEEYLLMGGLMAPFEASQLLRGLRTLSFRMKAHEENALKVAHFLEKHPAVSKVNYPGLKSHPDYELGKSQLAGYSGLMSFELKEANYKSVKKVVDGTKVFQIGVSWGSFESLILSPNIGKNAKQLENTYISPGLIRLAVGLEESSLLIEDLQQALKRL
jgi:cystathionine beta-lyase/cystathionine gamma-synthase